MINTAYHFEAKTTTDFICNFSTPLNNRALKYLQNQLMKNNKLAKVNKILIPPKCNNYLLITLKQIILEIDKEVFKDGINIIHKEITQAIFRKTNDVWNLDISLKGLYNEKN